MIRAAETPFALALQQCFPGAMPETVYVGRTYERLFELGFDDVNTFACVSVCRDELTSPLVRKVTAAWGEAFNFSSLAGMVFMGRTGFRAALHHAPACDGRTRYCFFALPHIAISQSGTVGRCHRSGQDTASSACGALSAFRAEIEGGSPSLELDREDLEQSLLKRRLSEHLEPGARPSLPALTRLALEVITSDLEHLIGLEIDTEKSDYAVLTGVQIHGPGGRDFVAPSAFYAVVDGRRLDLTV